MKIPTLLFLCLALTACDGIQFENEITPPSDPKKFATSDFNNRAFFSREITQSATANGFILLFKPSTVDEFGFVLNDADKVLSGRYNWVISNDKLQVTYTNPATIVCTTEKEDDNNQKITAKIASCSGGTPKNARIQDALNKALSLTTDNLAGNKITIDVKGKKEIINFSRNDSSLTLSKEDNGITSAPENGSYEKSLYKNLVKLDFPSSNEYRQWLLMTGNTTTNGILLDLRFIRDTDKLKQVRIYTISNNNVWKATEVRSSIEFD
jgi:hypothetical protein